MSGAAFNGGVVIWGTLLQRRVPPEMLGRVSSVDFFVSLAFMPISMAVAGPVGELVGLPVVFLIAGVAPLVIGVVAIVAARMTRDEVANPIQTSDEAEAEAIGALASRAPRSDAMAGQSGDRMMDHGGGPGQPHSCSARARSCRCRCREAGGIRVGRRRRAHPNGCR